MTNAWTGGQYSVYRALFGAYLFVHFAHLLPWGTEVFSSAGMLPDAALSPLSALFPNVLTWFDAPAVVATLLASAAGAAVAFALGWRDKWAALWMWYVLACLFGRNPLIANPALPYVGWMLLAHLFVPAAPYGSLAARGRADPGGGWRLPREVFLAAWIVLALSYTYSGYTKLLSPSWVDGSTLLYVLQNPLARDWFLRDFFLALPAWVLQSITLFILWLEFLFAPLALSRRLRPWLWCGMLLVQFGFAFLLNFPDLTIPMLLFHLLTFDPAWIPARPAPQPEEVYYDGHCGLCHRVVRFILAEDRARAFRLGPLQGSAFERALDADTRRALPDSFVVRRADGSVLLRSAAAAYVLEQLGGLWRVAGWVLMRVPQVVRDGAYDFVGGVRQRLFARPDELCPLVPADLRERFLP
jgi:predicted DCC family thiol-disulfide oxidoreductase YuxK